MSWDLDALIMDKPVSNSHLNRLHRAWMMQHGGPAVPYAELRMLEKKKLIVIYRNRDGSVMTPIVKYDGLKLLGKTGFEPEVRFDKTPDTGQGDPNVAGA